jgi:hypothetical protein
MTSKMDHTREPQVAHSTRADAERSEFEEDDVQAQWRRVVGRRSFFRGVGLAGAAVVPGGALLASRAIARSSAITKGDIAVLRFFAAAELIESDLWQQYNELGGVKGGNPAYMAALSNLDSDMPQYIADNTDDEISHAAFLNAYLRSKGADPVNLDEFRTLPSSTYVPRPHSGGTRLRSTTRSEAPRSTASSSGAPASSIRASTIPPNEVLPPWAPNASGCSRTRAAAPES